MTHAHFVRSPHAHAKIKSIDTSAAMKMPGVVGVLTGQQIVDDKIGNLICGWAITSKDGTADEDGRVAGDGAGDRALRRPGGRGGDRRDQEPGAATRPKPWSSTYEELPAVADIRAAIKPGAPQLHPEAPGNVIYDWAIGDEAATNAAFTKAAPMSCRWTSPTTAWCRTRWSRARRSPNTTSAEEHFTLYTTSQNPHVARLVLSAFYNIAPEHKLRVIAPDVGGGFGSKIFIYPEEMVALWASKKVGRPVKWTGDRTEAFLDRRAWPRPSRPRPRWRSTRTTRSPACASRPTPISAPTCRCSRRRCRPISTRRCCRASTTSRPSTPR